MWQVIKNVFNRIKNWFGRVFQRFFGKKNINNNHSSENLPVPSAGESVPILIQQPLAQQPQVESGNNLMAVFHNTQQYARKNHPYQGKSIRYRLSDQPGEPLEHAFIFRMAGTQKLMLRYAEVGSETILSQTESKHPYYEVSNEDTLSAAKGIAQSGHRPLILNFANAFTVGGGVEDGAKAQEEDLFRCSNYGQTDLYGEDWSCTVSGTNRRWYWDPIPAKGCVYTPGLTAFKAHLDTGNYQMITPFQFDAVAVAAINLNGQDTQLKWRDDNWDPKRGLMNEKVLSALIRSNDSKDRELGWKIYCSTTQKKIRCLLRVAVLHGHRHLVLGALGCGAFALPDGGETAKRVAVCFQQVLNEAEFSGKFDEIKFAILARNERDKVNLAAFQAVFSCEPTHSFKQKLT